MTVFQSDSVGFDGGWVTYDKWVRRLNGVGGLRGVLAVRGGVLAVKERRAGAGMSRL